MASKLEIPLHEEIFTIMRQHGANLGNILDTKFRCVAAVWGVRLENQSSTPYQRGPSTISAEKRLEIIMPSGVKVSVWKADLTTFPTVAVVNAANEKLQHYGGLARALSSAGGPQIQKESDDYIKKHVKLETGEAVVFDAGLLPCKKIIHAVGPELPYKPTKNDVSKARPFLKKTILSILDEVEKHGLVNVAIPAISSGLFNYPLPECAHTIVSTVKQYYERRRVAQEIFLVNHDEPTVQAMETACHQIFRPQRNHEKDFKEEKGNFWKGSQQLSSPHKELRLGGKCSLKHSPGQSSGSQHHPRQEASGRKADSYISRASTPHLILLGQSDESTQEAEKWLNRLLSMQSHTITIYNNFISHFRMEDHLRLESSKGLLMKKYLIQGHASIEITSKSKEETVFAALEVEAMLCKIQKEFISEEEGELQMLSQTELSCKRETIEKSSREFLGRSAAFGIYGLRVMKVEKLENNPLKLMFDLKKKQLGSSSSRTMFQCIPAQFCEMISRIGFQAECAPPEDPKNVGIYFAGNVKKALEMWKKGSEEYLYFVEAEVVRGKSASDYPGNPMPRPAEKEPKFIHDSVDAGPDVSVILSGYQALPMYIVICKMDPIIHNRRQDCMIRDSHHQNYPYAVLPDKF